MVVIVVICLEDEEALVKIELPCPVETVDIRLVDETKVVPADWEETCLLKVEVGRLDTDVEGIDFPELVVMSVGSGSAWR